MPKNGFVHFLENTLSKRNGENPWASPATLTPRQGDPALQERIRPVFDDFEQGPASSCYVRSGS